MDDISEDESNQDLLSLANKYMHDNNIASNPFDIMNINSEYYNVNDMFPENLHNMSFQYKVMHLNIQGLNSKFEEFKILLAQMDEIQVKMDVILLCETFINDYNAALFNLPGYNLIYKNRKHMVKGGVAIYIRDTIQFKIRDDLSLFKEGEFESVFIETCDKHHPAIIGEIYRIPNTNAQLSLERFTTTLNKLEKVNKQVIIGTDQNFDYLKIHSDTVTSDLFDVCLSSNLIPTITKPTRVTHTSATLIDNLYVGHTNSNIHSGIIYNRISDHFPIFCFVGKQKYTKPKEPLTFTHRPLSSEASTLITNAIREKDWEYLNNMETDDAYNEFTIEVNKLLDNYAPEKTTVIQPKYVIREKWMTRGLMRSSNTLNKLYRKCCKKPKIHPTYVKYITYRNCYNKLKYVAKTKYYSELFYRYKNNIKETWKVLKTLISHKNDKSFIPVTFKHNNEMISNPDNIANLFCQYFSNVGLEYANLIPKSHRSYSDYVAMNRHRNPNTLYFSPTDPNEIIKIIKSLKSTKSCGNDNISSLILKQAQNSISVPLSILINKSLSTGTFPDTLKIAKVIPIYKSKDRDNIANYRPISLLSSLSKVLEKVVHKRLYYFIEINDIFNENQYGFRPKHSTVNAVTHFVNDTIKSLENKETTLSVFLDLSKAFDTIDHNILLKKLEFYGVRGLPLKWFTTYLNNRKQFVQYNKSRSETLNINCGVPQGSVLGPLLFIIYTNDLPNCLTKTKSILFADDTTIYASSRNIIDLYANMNNDLSKLNDWFRANKLSLNVNKTNYLLFTNSQINYSGMLNIKINNEIIKCKSCVKFLGIFIDDRLHWHEHINSCKSKLISSLYAINKIKHLVPENTLKALYYTLVYPHLTYGITLWGSTYNVHINKLRVMQNKIIRAMLNANFTDPSKPLYAKLQILRLDDVYKLELGKYMYQYINNNLPQPLLNMFEWTKDIHSYQTRQQTYLRPFKHRLNVTKQSLLCKGPEVWNTLPEDIKQKYNLSSYVYTLKFSLTKEYGT